MVPDDELVLPLRATDPYAVATTPGAALPAAGGRPSGRLLASWRRSQEYGVSLESVDPQWAGTPDGGSLFVQCGHEVLTGLHQTLADEPLSFMLTDADGLVLNRFSGNTSLLRALDTVHLAPGFSYSEREAGTNGVGLALADRVPTVVKAEEHYSASLCTYTCAAVPVLNPLTGQLEGSVNITTWSRSSTGLLLALAQSAAGNTAALMLARSQGHLARPLPRGEVVRVETTRLEPGSGTVHDLSSAWTDAVREAADAMRHGKVVAAVGEPGSGRSTLLAQAQRIARPRDRILSAAAPAPHDVEAWLTLWTPELGKAHTSIIVSDIDALPAWAADSLHDLVVTARSWAATSPDDGHGEVGGPAPVPWSVTAERFAGVAESVATLVDVVVQVPPLRDRPDDIIPLALHTARRTRGREVEITASAESALRSCGWPGNTDQLVRVVRAAALRSDTIDVRHLAAEVLSRTSRRLSSIEAFERDEIVRCLTRPGATVKEAATELGMSRATIYRKIAQYDIRH